MPLHLFCKISSTSFCHAFKLIRCCLTDAYNPQSALMQIYNETRQDKRDQMLIRKTKQKCLQFAINIICNIMKRVAATVISIFYKSDTRDVRLTTEAWCRSARRRMDWCCKGRNKKKTVTNVISQKNIFAFFIFTNIAFYY